VSRLVAVALLAALLGGCAVPSWVPWLGKRKPSEPAAQAPAPPPPTRPPRVVAPAAPAGGRDAAADSEEGVVDRIIAVVNNDAITLAELQESIAGYRQENRGRGTASDEELAKQFLTRLIDVRLQLQEAEREKITVEEPEVAEELAERVKRYGLKTVEEFEALIKTQGLNMDSIKRRLREAILVQKVVRRKVALRVSVTDVEIDRYLEENRAKLETGLAYHARHILVVPEAGPTDQAWEAARIKAELIRKQLAEGADFAELARQHSRDPGSAKDGGDLGTLKRGELAADIEAEILSLEPGRISRPFRSTLGYHVFRLDSKEALEGEGLTRARQQIREILFRQKYEARLDTWLREIKQRAIIEVRM
jgi:peptidyl-prolyl cis-trans isomerase SurA